MVQFNTPQNLIERYCRDCKANRWEAHVHLRDHSSNSFLFCFSRDLYSPAYRVPEIKTHSIGNDVPQEEAVDFKQQNQITNISPHLPITSSQTRGPLEFTLNRPAGSATWSNAINNYIKKFRYKCKLVITHVESVPCILERWKANKLKKRPRKTVNLIKKQERRLNKQQVYGTNLRLIRCNTPCEPHILPAKAPQQCRSKTA